MNTPPLWWQQEEATSLSDTLAFVNSSVTRTDEISRCDDLGKALINTGNAFYRYRRDRGMLSETEIKNISEGKYADHQSLKALVLLGLTPEQTTSWCMCDSVRSLATLAPLVMDHSFLVAARYDPQHIPDELRKNASVKHHKLSNAYARFVQHPSDASLRDTLLNKLQIVLYMVRSNIAHSNKTPRGPDVAKATRDRLVSQVTSSVLRDLFEALFSTPSQRLAVYGTLAPGEPNASLLGSVAGQWSSGIVQGVVAERHGLKEFTWTTEGDSIPVKVLSAERLAQQFDAIDRFEGPNYRRILVPVEINGLPCVCNIYEGIVL
jgi:gamma-glutamylcyclotransferase (GGCT)/AIG2-like uncharacterized protein YtfP